MKKLIAIAALMCGTAHAEFFTGNDLLNRLNSENTYERGTAIGYILGAHDTGRGAVHCSPDGATGTQVRDIVKAHLESTPEVRHLAADSHVTFILRKVWPCAEKKKGTSL